MISLKRAAPFLLILAGGVMAISLGQRGWTELAYVNSLSRVPLRVKVAQAGYSNEKQSIASPKSSNLLPANSDSSEVIRYLGHVATDLGVTLGKVEVEPNPSRGAALDQTRIAVHATGDYVHIKALMISILNKFPGLVLQRIAIQHRMGDPEHARDKPSDDATLQFIQFTRPVQIDILDAP